MPSSDEADLRQIATDLRQLAETEPTIAGELRRIADQLDPAECAAIYSKTELLAGSLHGSSGRSRQRQPPFNAGAAR